MYRIGELERVTRDLRQDVRELRGLLELAGQRIRELEDEHASDIRRLWSHIGNMPGGV
jgi:hypothetical protein